MATTPRWGFTYMVAGQRMGEILYNETLARVAFLMNCSVDSMGDTIAPSSHVDGEGYILGTSPSGNWSDFAEDDLVFSFNQSWIAFTPFEGMRAWVEDLTSFYTYNGSSWAAGPT